MLVLLYFFVKYSSKIRFLDKLSCRCMCRKLDFKTILLKNNLTQR